MLANTEHESHKLDENNIAYNLSDAGETDAGAEVSKTRRSFKLRPPRYIQ